MPKLSTFAEILKTITKDVIDHPRDLTRYYSERFGISRVASNRHIKNLETEGWIARSGPSTHPVFSPSYKRQMIGFYELSGLEEDIVWRTDFKPYFNLQPNVQGIVEHGFTEILNNAIDHSAGDQVEIRMDQYETFVSITISDNGIGIFDKISTELQLPDVRQALFELSKGKLTTDPSRHTGEGVFFTSRMFDRFMIYANGLIFDHSQDRTQDKLHEIPDTAFPKGTIVCMIISPSCTRTTNDVYSQFTDAPDDYDFSKTIVPMRLAKYGDEQLVSRSQAKRLIARFERFKTVVLDFSEIQEIGQAFADELFRVYANKHPAVDLQPKNMNEQVERMWLRAVAPRI
jgi:DNA-binding Lrp family transcriptional regulator